MGNKFIEHDRCTFRRVRNRFQPQTSLWKYENTMLIKIVAMFRNLLISSFDATIRVKRAFHRALASRGFASHVFLVERFTCSRDRKTEVVLVAVCEPTKDARFFHFSGGPKRARSRKFNFSNFQKNKRALELLIVIFENSSPKGTFR